MTSVKIIPPISIQCVVGKLGEFSSKEYCFDITPHSEKRPKKVSMITGLVKNEKDCQARHPCYQNETEQEDAINIASYQRLNKKEAPFTMLATADPYLSLQVLWARRVLVTIQQGLQDISDCHCLSVFWCMSSNLTQGPCCSSLLWNEIKGFGLKKLCSFSKNGQVTGGNNMREIK